MWKQANFLSLIYAKLFEEKVNVALFYNQNFIPLCLFVEMPTEPMCFELQLLDLVKKSPKWLKI